MATSVGWLTLDVRRPKRLSNFDMADELLLVPLMVTKNSFFADFVGLTALFFVVRCCLLAALSSLTDTSQRLAGVWWASVERTLVGL